MPIPLVSLSTVTSVPRDIQLVYTTRISSCCSSLCSMTRLSRQCQIFSAKGLIEAWPASVDCGEDQYPPETPLGGSGRSHDPIGIKFRLKWRVCVVSG